MQQFCQICVYEGRCKPLGMLSKSRISLAPLLYLVSNYLTARVPDCIPLVQHFDVASYNQWKALTFSISCQTSLCNSDAVFYVDCGIQASVNHLHLLAGAMGKKIKIVQSP